MGTCIFNILEAPGPMTDIGTLLGALFSSLFSTLSISYVYLTNTIFMKFRQTLGPVWAVWKRFPQTKVDPVQLRQIWARSFLRSRLSDSSTYLKMTSEDICREQWTCHQESGWAGYLPETFNETLGAYTMPDFLAPACISWSLLCCCSI